MQIVAPLEIEDYVIQTAEFMSPPRWHVGHTSWFFETLLQTYKPDYKLIPKTTFTTSTPTTKASARESSGRNAAQNPGRRLRKQLRIANGLTS